LGIPGRGAGGSRAGSAFALLSPDLHDW